MRSPSLIRQAAIYTGSNILTAAIPFLLLPLLTRVLSPADYGIVAMFGVMVSVFAAFTGLNTQGAIAVRFHEQDKVDIARYVTTCLGILLLSTFAALVVVALARAPLETTTSVPSEWLLIGVLVAAMQFVVLVRLSLLQMSKQVWKYGTLQIGQTAMNAGLSVWFVLQVGLTWQGRTWAIALAAAMTMCFACIGLWKGGFIKWPMDASYAKNALRFGVPLIPHSLGSLLISTVDRALITSLLDIAQTGIFTVALQVGMILSLLTGALNQAFAPWLFEHLKSSSEAGRFRIVRYTYLYFAALFVVAVLFGVLAPWVLPILVGPEFQSSADTVIYISCGFAFGGMYYMVTNYVFLAGATAKLALITLSAGLLNVAVSYMLIKELGLKGAGFGFMCSHAFLFLGTWILAQHVHPMPWRKAMVGLTRKRTD